MWAKIVAIWAAIVAFFGVLWALMTGAQAKKDIKTMQKLQDDYAKIDAKAAADTRSDEDILKGGVK